MRNWLALAGAISLTLPGVFLRVLGISLEPPAAAALFGLAILGAAFLLTWAAEVAELEISQSLALALIALVAVLPEYAVDLYFAWTAAKKAEYAAYATANMTGANRLLVGVGWSLIVFLFWMKNRGKKALELGKAHTTELTFLALATLYSFTIPWKGSLHLIDTVILLSLFVLYLWAASRAPREEPQLVGPPAAVATLSTRSRRAATLFLFLFSGFAILLAAAPFAEGLIEVGKMLKISEFLLVQWIAPLASEAPEVIIAVLFTLRGVAGAGMGALISSKVNQWTLLIGTLPLIYSISLGRAGALPLDARQMEEIFLTSAQSAFAVVLLANLRLNLWNAAALFLLFSTQLVFTEPWVRYGYSIFYLIFALSLLLGQRERLKGLYGMVPYVANQLRSPPGNDPSPPA